VQEWEFDVGVSTHDLLKQGVIVRHYTRVSVAASSSYVEARLIACQLAACGGWMPTKAALVA
jgi:hypothetical protein